MSTEDIEQGKGGENKAPALADPALFDQWLKEVDIWAWTQTKQKEKLGAKLLNAQFDHSVKKIMFEVDMNDIKSERGLDKILDRMKQYYGKPTETLAWSSFSTWFTMYRKKDEPADEFTRRFMSAFAGVQSYDKEVSAQTVCWVWSC